MHRAGIDGFTMTVAADPIETTQQFAAVRKSSVKPMTLAGYPAAQVPLGSSCMLSLDVSNHGSLFIDGSVPSGKAQPCELAKNFAQAALKNLPNA